ncbi:MAG TPA: HAMP domain-containing methyl-accepting chemotaxis protein [Xanthobacteraceae bacterium]|nr:HAMP domain-containing methyl-accepting chemotaxis protein [Xanthobacteraceae bacterium]
MLRFRSVGGKIAAAFIILVLPILAWALGSKTYQGWKAYHNAKLVEEQNGAANNLIAGVYEILMERLATNNALLANDPAGSDVLAEIQKRRSVAMQKIPAAHVALSGQDFPNKQALLGELKAALDKADGYRKRADEAVKQAKASRDADTVKNLFVALSELSATAQNVWAAVLASTSAIDAELGRLSTVRILAWNLRDIAGFERSHIAQSISAKTPIPADKLTAIAEVRAQVTLMWRLLQINIRTPEHPAIAKGLQNAKEGYFAKLQPLADQMRKISSEGANYGMSTQQWVGTTTPLLFTLLDIMYGAGEASEVHTAQLATSALTGFIIDIMLFLLGLAAAGLAVWTIIRTVARPLGDLARVMTKLGAHDQRVTVPHADRPDEVGQMAFAMQTFRENFVAMEKQRRDHAVAQDEQAKRGERLAIMAGEFEQKISGIVSAVSSAANQFASAAEQMAGAAEEGARTANAVATASEEAYANVQTVASSTEQLSGSINEISQQVTESTRIAENARQIATSTNENVKTLADAANSIGDVIKLISAIAEQTNLLALNATIEAARAGDAGRGFAVVASEVKTLAGQTAKATEQISSQIQNVQEATGDAVEAIGSITKTIDQINAIAATIANAVQEQSVATREISNNVRQTAVGTQEVASNVVTVKDAATNTGRTASQLMTAAGSLKQQSQQLSMELDRFLKAVRAA